MTRSIVVHTSFVIERDLPGTPRHAFRFWSEPDLKARWNDCHPDWTVLEDAFDFRVGGAEIKRWRTAEGPELAVRSYFLDIAPADRIIYAYEMTFGGERISASLVTVQFMPVGSRTNMTFTEQAAFLGGTDARQRQIGTDEGFDRLVEEMIKAAP